MLSDIQRPVGGAMLKPLWRSVLGVGAAPPPLPDPTTVNFTSAQVSPGFAGSVSYTANASNVHGRASLTVWAGVITGTEAKITANTVWGAGGLPGMILVAVDGGAYTVAPNVGTLFTLFTGLPHGPHFVEWKYSSGMGDSVYIPATGNVLAVTGQPPALQSLANWVQSGIAQNAGSYLSNIANFTQPLLAPSGNTYASNTSSLNIRGSFNMLRVYSQNSVNRVGVSKNGGAAVYYQMAGEAASSARIVSIPCDGSLSTYTVWNGGTTFSGGGHFAVAGDAVPVSAGTAYKLDQYGDSITFGASADPADVETMQVAASLGKLGSTNGISGHTIAQCKALLDVILPLKTVTSDDVAVLAIGRNNVGTIDSTEQADYNLCVDKLLAKGYGKVLCRAIIPSAEGASLWTAENATLQGLVTARANPNVIWVPTVTWWPYGSPDNTHPNAAGYVTLAGFAEPAYRAALGL